MCALRLRLVGLRAVVAGRGTDNLRGEVQWPALARLELDQRAARELAARRWQSGTEGGGRARGLAVGRSQSPEPAAARTGRAGRLRRRSRTPKPADVGFGARRNPDLLRRR